jgi:putative PIN family toxin of toxin-antitoxin system
LRAVLDANILISAVISPKGAPARALSAWLEGEYELVVSELLLAEVERVFADSKLRDRVGQTDAAAFIQLLRESGEIAADPEDAPRLSKDPGDDYLIALAEAERAVLVTGDRHLLELAGRLPVRTVREFVDSL